MHIIPSPTEFHRTFTSIFERNATRISRGRQFNHAGPLGNDPVDRVYWIDSGQIYFSSRGPWRRNNPTRYWNAFGTSLPNDGRLDIDCEVNYGFHEFNNRSAARLIKLGDSIALIHNFNINVRGERLRNRLEQEFGGSTTLWNGRTVGVVCSDIYADDAEVIREIADFVHRIHQYRL